MFIDTSTAQLKNTLSQVQAKLAALEEENSISRRRMRELEHELEICKSEVVRERTRVLEAGDFPGLQAPSKGKGKARAPDRSDRSMDRSMRYKEVVEEKKGMYITLVLCA